MTKHASATNTYNAIFQEYSPPGRAIIGRRHPNPPLNVQSFDKGISCHVFAIASPSSWDSAKEVNNQYSDIGSGKAIERALSGRKPTPQERLIERPQNMTSILGVRQLQETVLPVDNMYMCGGFREGQVVPEHMWIEDRTNNITYDTFINRNGIAVVKGVGVDGEEFQPGCEGHAFDGGDIQRVKVEGYTWGQLLAIAAGAEKERPEDDPFPDSIKDNPIVLAAKMAIKEAESALAEIPDAGLTEEEVRVVQGVYKEQRKQTTQKDIDDVVKSLKEEYKLLHASGLEKLKTEGEEQRRVAREIVGLGPAFFLEKVKVQQLTEKANERIEATLAAVTDVRTKDLIKNALEKQRDDLLKTPSPSVALEAFNKSMSDPNIGTLAKGIRDGLKVLENPTLKEDDPIRAVIDKQMKTMISSYASNDGKLAELSLALTTNERIEATLAAVTDVNAKDFIRKVLEKQRDDILKTPSPADALDAFNKSMSDPNIVVLAKGVNDAVTAVGNSMFGDEDQAPKVIGRQVKTLVASYIANDGRLAELSLGLTAMKNQLSAGPYADVLALTKRFQEMDGLPKTAKEYARNLVERMRELPLEQRVNFPNSKEEATFSALEALLTTNKKEPQRVDESTPDLGQKVIEKLDAINADLDERALQTRVQI